MTKKKKTSEIEKFRPPIVAVLGHVDHGKTSLLDYIRKTEVAKSEHGGITQSIGAYQIPGITFIDTPGHEAFAKMRSRGASASDIAVLVVAADDGVMPQTKESIRMITEAKIPMIVAINKIDLPTAQIDKVKKDLGRAGVQVEDYGGSIPSVAVSAKTGKGVKELLEMIKLVADMKEFTSEPLAPIEAIVIETRVDVGKGTVATVIVKKGTLQRGVTLYDGKKQVVRIRALFDERGQGVAEAPPSKPVEILGFTQMPNVGALLTEKPMEGNKLPAGIAEKISERSIENFLSGMQKEKKLAIVIRADSYGSLEAIREALKDNVAIVTSGIGDITDADVLISKSTGAFIIGFNVKLKKDIEKLAQIEGVVCRTYTVIYTLLEELREVIEAGTEVISRERELGMGTVIAEFPFNGKRIAGIKVVSGRIAKGDQAKVMRKDHEVGRAKIKSMRQGKEEETKVEAGTNCGIQFDRDIAFDMGDGIIAFTNR